MLNYFFTKPDPDFKLKGSRDPLGLQVVWKETAQQIVAYLSTVSYSLKDFQTLCFAYYFQNRKEKTHIGIDLNFFLRFEQACAYARYNMDHTKSFNGKDKVVKLYPDYKANNSFVLDAEKHQLLSNQRAYGIWGKYSRPFRDMKIYSDENFYDIFNQKIVETNAEKEIYNLVTNIESFESFLLKVEDLSLLQKLFDKITESERELYREHILKTKIKHLQNELYAILIENKASIPEISLYKITSFLLEHSKTDEFKNAVFEIEKTEQIICPLNRIFRYLQTAPYGWHKTNKSGNAILNDDFITSLNKHVDYSFKTAIENKNDLNSIFNDDNWLFIEKLVGRNRKVAENRSSLPWLTIENENVKINSSDGSFFEKYIPGETFDNLYLLNTYLNLFFEIEGY